jgi:hypothetical protein
MFSHGCNKCTSAHATPQPCKLNSNPVAHLALLAHLLHNDHAVLQLTKRRQHALQLRAGSQQQQQQQQTMRMSVHVTQADNAAWETLLQ